jgi:hypothetical protein
MAHVSHRRREVCALDSPVPYWWAMLTLAVWVCGWAGACVAGTGGVHGVVGAGFAGRAVQNAG